MQHCPCPSFQCSTVWVPSNGGSVGSDNNDDDEGGVSLTCCVTHTASIVTIVVIVARDTMTRHNVYVALPLHGRRRVAHSGGAAHKCDLPCGDATI